MTTENTKIKKYQSISHGLGIRGLIVGIITLLVSFIPCFGVFSLIFGIIAILFSVIGLAIALKHDHPKGLIIGALVTAFLGCAIAYTQYSAMKGKGTVDTIKEIEQNRIENQKQAK